jgi:putative ABC transport system permease protein
MKTFFRKLAWLVARRRREDELREEIAFHLAEEAEERRAAGLDEDRARLAARRDLGNVALVVEDTRAAWGWRSAEQLAQDVRYAFRMIVRAPAVTFAVMVTLALGIGLTTAMFSIVHGILLRPLPLPDPDRLVVVQTRMVDGEIENAVSPPNFMSLGQEESRSFVNLTAVVMNAATLTGGDEARRVSVGLVSASFFDVFHVRPVIGRVFNADENSAGRNRVAVLSHALWQQQFGSDPGVLGRTIRLDAIAHTVIGVMPQGFEVPSERALWVPQQYGRNYFSAEITEGRKNNAYVLVIARLRPEASLTSARAELDTIASRLAERFPDTNAGVAFRPVRLQDVLVADVTTPLLMLLGAVAFVLLIAVANVAGLLLARGASRREEIAMRAALGASRPRIVRQLVTESLLLSLGGGALGFVLSIWVTTAITTAQAEGLRRNGVVDAIRVDGFVLTFALAVTILAGIAAGLVPAWRAAKEGMATTLRESGHRTLGSARGQRLRSALVVAQLVLAVVLLHGAGLLANSFARLTGVDPGFQAAGAMSFQIALPARSYGSAERVSGFFGALFAKIREQPGVQSAGAISRLPIGMPGSFSSRFEIEGQSRPGEQPSISARIVTPDYFRTVGMAMLRGRGITESDGAGQPAAVVINEAAVARFFPGESPIGRRLVRFTYDPLEDASEAYTIVGVVSDVRSRNLGEAPQPQAYFSHAQVPLRDMSVVVRSADDPLAHSAAIRRALASIDRDIPAPAFATLDQVLAQSLDRPRFFATLLGSFSLVALLLAAVGIFGLVSFAAARRTREFGVRIALGASPRELLLAIVRGALGLVAIGLVVGLGGAALLTRVLEGLLYGVTATDPVTFAAVAVTLALTAVVASIVPAARAAAVDPVSALRAE